MPDRQAIYEELERRGALKDPRKQEIVQELARRGVLHLRSSENKQGGADRGIPIPPEASARKPSATAPSPASAIKTGKPSKKVPETAEARAAREEIEKNISYHEAEASRLRSERSGSKARFDTAMGKLSGLDVVGAAKSLRPEDLNPFSHMREVTAPIQQLLGHVLGGLPDSPHQLEVNRQKSKLPFAKQLQAQDPRGLLHNIAPTLTRRVEATPSRGAAGLAKGVISSGMDMATVDNALIAAGLGSHLPVLSKAAQGYFGAEAAKATAEGLKKWKESGFKDTEALGRATASATMAASIAHHGLKDTAPVKALRSRMAPKPVDTEALRAGLAPKVEPKAAPKPDVAPEAKAAPERVQRTAARTAARKPKEAPAPLDGKTKIRLNNHEPVPAAAVAKAGVKPPVGYVRQGDLLVYKEPAPEVKPKAEPEAAKPVAVEPKKKPAPKPKVIETDDEAEDRRQAEEADPDRPATAQEKVVASKQVQEFAGAVKPGTKVLSGGRTGLPAAEFDVVKVNPKSIVLQRRGSSASGTRFAPVTYTHADLAEYFGSGEPFYVPKESAKPAEKAPGAVAEAPKAKTRPITPAAPEKPTEAPVAPSGAVRGSTAELAAKKAGERKSGPVKLSPNEATTLGAHHDPGNVFGDRLSMAEKPFALTGEEAAAMRRLVEQKRLNKKLFPSLYPEEKGAAKSPRPSAKDKAILEKGKQELGGGFFGFDPRAMLQVAKEHPSGQAVRDRLFGDKPALTATSKEGLHAVNVHENARITQHLEANEVVPQVTAHLAPEDNARFLTYGVADRILAERDKMNARMTQIVDEVTDLDKKIAASKRGRDLAMKSGDAGLVKKWQSEMDSHTRERTNLLTESTKTRNLVAKMAVGRRSNPLTVTLPDGTKQVVTEAGVKKFFSRPEIQEALRKHRDVETYLNRNQTMQGAAAGVSLGKHSGAYFPAEALDLEGAVRLGAGGKGGKHAPAAQMSRNVHANKFTGTAHDYSSDYEETIRRDLANSYSRATERRMHSTLLSEGVEQIYEEGNPNLRREDGKLEIKVNGKWEPGYDFTIQKGVRVKGGQIRGVEDGGLPTQLVLPTRIYNEMAPMFDRDYQTASEKLASGWFGKYMQLYLLKPADMVQHGAALGSRATYGALRAPMNEFKRTAKASIAVGQSVTNFIRFFNPNLYKPATRTAALRFASETGILPKDFGGDSGFFRQAGRATKALMRRDVGKAIEEVGHLGHDKLYGDRGILANAATSVYNEFERSGALKTPEGRTLLREALRETFNTQAPTDQAQLSERLRAIGFATFYETGVKNRTAALSAGGHVYAASLAGRAMLTVGLVKAVTGQYPWQIPGYKWGYIPIGRDDDGRHVYLDGKMLDRVGFYPDVWVQAVMDSKTRGFGAGGKALQATSTFANWALAPATSGPLAQGIGATLGPIPFVHPNKDLSGVEFGASSLTKYGLTGKRAAGIATSMLPAAGLAYDPAMEAMPGEPKNEKLKAVNRFLPFLGLPPLRAGQEGAVLLLHDSQAEKRSQHKPAKKKSGGFFSGKSAF